MISQDAASIALMVADALTNTPELDESRRDALRGSLLKYARGEWEEGDVFAALLGAGFEITPPYDGALAKVLKQAE